MPHGNWRWLGAVCILGVCCAPEELLGEDLEQVLVTARKRPEQVWEVPFSVDVQTQAQLEERRATDGISALRGMTGAGMTTYGDRNNAFIVVRGVAPIVGPLSPDDSSVLTFIDGAPLPISGSNSAYLDLERVEVLKGPQSALFGRNTAGGAVNLIPAEPTFIPERRVRAEYGTENVYRAEGVLSGALLRDTLAGRLAIRRSGASPYIDNAFGRRLGGENSWVGRASLLFVPSERTRWLLNASAEDSENTPIYYLLSPGPPRAAQNLARDDGRHRNLSSKIEWAFDRAALAVQTAYASSKVDNTFNYPDFFLASEMTGFPPQAFTDPATNHNIWRKEDKRFTQELRLSSAPQTRAPWMAGAVYYRDQADYGQDVNLLDIPTIGGAKSYDAETDGYALFGDLSLPVAAKLTLSLSGRVTHEEKSFVGEYSANGITGVVPHFIEEGARTYEFWSGRAAVRYEWSESLIAFGNVSRGYKSGGFGLYNTLAFAGVPRTPYGASSMMSYEIGSRASLLDRRLRMTAALFLNEVEDEQILAWDYTTFAAEALNIGTRSTGAELDATYRWGERWQLSAGGAYTDAALQNVSAQVMALQPGVADDNRPPNVPELTARAEITYRASAAGLRLGGFLSEADMSGRIGYHYVGKRYTDAENRGVLDPVRLLSARFGLDWQSGEVYVFGENLLGRRYKTVNQPWGVSVLTGAPIFGASYARGAVVGAGVSVAF